MMHVSVREKLSSKLNGSMGTYVLLILFITLSLVHMSAYFEGRFWGEEGAVFYKSMDGESIWSGLFFIYNGHLELVTNLIVYISTFFPFRIAPAITTYLSFLFQLVPVAVIIFYRHALGLTFLGMVFLVIVLVGLPHAPEVWANSINLHFHFALLAVVILGIPIGTYYPYKFFRGLLLLTGLSGIPTNFLFPLFLISAVVEKDRERFVQAGILGVTAFVQLALLFLYGQGVVGERLGFDFMVYWFAVISQLVVSPIASVYVGAPGSGIYLSERIQSVLLRALSGDSRLIIYAVAFSVPLIYFLFLGVVSRARTVLVFMGSMLLLSFAFFITSLGDKMVLISFNNPRYFYIPTVLMVLFVLLIFTKSKNFLLGAYFSVLCLFSVLSIGPYHGGKPWPEAIREAYESKSAVVEIWPAGWFMPIPKESIPK